MLLDQNDDEGFRSWVGDRLISTPGSNIDSKALPFQSWRPFKEAFAPEIVHRAASETPGSVKRLLDPFGGSGTSALTAQFLGIHPTTIEVNPFLADLIEAKLTSYNLASLTSEYGRVIEKLKSNVRGRPVELKGLPPTFVQPGVKGRYIFSRDVANRLAKLLKAIDEVCSQDNARLFKVLTATVALEVSNITISGKGRRYRKNWQDRLSDVSACVSDLGLG